MKSRDEVFEDLRCLLLVDGFRSRCRYLIILPLSTSSFVLLFTVRGTRFPPHLHRAWHLPLASTHLHEASLTSSAVEPHFTACFLPSLNFLTQAPHSLRAAQGHRFAALPASSEASDGSSLRPHQPVLVLVSRVARTMDPATTKVILGLHPEDLNAALQSLSRTSPDDLEGAAFAAFRDELMRGWNKLHDAVFTLIIVREDDAVREAFTQHAGEAQQADREYKRFDHGT